MANKTMADYTRKIKPYLEGVAPIEPTSTAASAHSVGDVFYFDGLLVKCTTAISVGDTIIVSPTTNYNVEESDDVVTQIKNGGGGGGGTYTAGNGINIDANNVISSDSVIFTGTKAEWEELTLEEKIQYTHAAWVGDEQSGAIDPVPTEDSNNLMTSGGIYNALSAKQDKLTNPLTKSDVVNNLTTTTTNVPLSAAQGKVLNDKIPYVGNYPSFVHQSFLNNTSMSFTINPNLGAIVIIQNTTAAAIVSVSGMYGSFHQIKIAGTFTNYTISAPDDKTVTVSTPDVVTVTIIGLISA